MQLPGFTQLGLGAIISAGPPSKLFEGHTQPRLFEDRFEAGDASAWKDYGTPTQRKEVRLAGGKGMVTLLETISDTDLMASADVAKELPLVMHENPHVQPAR